MRSSTRTPSICPADTLEPNDDAWELIRKLNKHYKFRTFLLDEVHFLPDPTALLKRLYDFLDVRVLFSSSVALAMRASAHDLSRRVRLLDLHVFSFREYLAFAHGISLPPLSLEEVAVRRWEPDHLRAGRFFDEYLRGGLGVVGLDEALSAAREGRVDTMIVSRTFRPEGRRCRDCEHLDPP